MGRAYSAAEPASPVLIRTASPIALTKILPSPISPVRAASVIVATMPSTCSSSVTISILSFVDEVDRILGSPIDLRVAFLATKPLHLSCRESLDTRFGERIAHSIEHVGLDDGGNQFHQLDLQAAVTAVPGLVH